MNTRNRRESTIELSTFHGEGEEVPLREDTIAVHHQDRFHYLDDVRRSWLRRMPEPNEGGFRVRAYLRLSLCILVTIFCVFALPLIVSKAVPKHKPLPPLPDNYTIALHKALLFFNAQKSGKLPKNNGISWRGDSGLKDGVNGSMAGGYYDSGINIKYNFPMSFATTILSWSVLEYEHKYRSTGEFDHIRDLIKWGTDYLLLTFDYNSTSIDKVYTQVGSRLGGLTTPNDESCWERPEDMDYRRLVKIAPSAPDLGGEMAAALAAASIVFSDDENAYSTILLKAARTVFSFALNTGKRVPYSWYSTDDNDTSYTSSGFWDELVWGATWLYYATGDNSYLAVATDPQLAQNASAATPVPSLRVLSWDNKLPAAMLLLTRVRVFLGPGYPYEEVLSIYHKTIDSTMCSYLREYHVFNFTQDGLIVLNKGNVQPLEYVVNSAFLASLYADYLSASDLSGWFCGDSYLPRATLKIFAAAQIRYILGANHLNLSYVVGYGAKFPRHVYHRGASVPNNHIKYSCTDGIKWRDNPKPDPNIIRGAMVGGPDRLDKFSDVRGNYSYTEPTVAGNAGLVAALVSLTSSGGSSVDKNTIFTSIYHFRSLQRSL